MRYLPAGVDIGSDRAVLDGRDLPVPRRVRSDSETGDVRKAPSPRGSHGRGSRFSTAGYPESVHVAYPQLDYQVEVYDPTPARAMRLVSAGRVRSLAAPAARRLQPDHHETGDRGDDEPDQIALPAARPSDLLGRAKARATRTSSARPRTGRCSSATSRRACRVGDPRASYTTVATYPFPAPSR